MIEKIESGDRLGQRRKSKATYILGHKKKKLLVLRIYQLIINGMNTAMIGFFMSLDIEVNILFLIIHKKN